MVFIVLGIVSSSYLIVLHIFVMTLKPLVSKLNTACKQLMSTLYIDFVCLSTVLAIWLKRKISDSLNTKFAKWSQFLDLAAGWASNYVGSILFSIPRMGLVKWLSCLSLAAFLKGNLHYCSLSPKKHRSSTFPAFGISAYALCGLWLLAIWQIEYILKYFCSAS
jgi:hypothetical protein